MATMRFIRKMAGSGANGVARVWAKPVALLADLQGAKVRLGWLDQEVTVAGGRQVVLVGMDVDVRRRPGSVEANAVILPVDFDLAPHVKAAAPS